VTDSIALGDASRYFDLTPSGDSIVTTLVTSRSLGIVDLRPTPPILTKIPLALDSATEPWYVRVTSAGSAFLLDIGTSSGHVYTYDLGTGVLRRRLDAGTAGETSGGPMARSYDRSVILINSYITQRYDAATDAFGPPQTSPAAGGVPALDGNGSHIAIGAVLYDGTMRRLVDAWAAPSILSPDGQTGYSVWYARRGVIRTRLSDGAILDQVRAPISPASGWLAPDGKTLVLSGGLDPGGTPGIAVLDLTRTTPESAPQHLVAVATVSPRAGAPSAARGAGPAPGPLQQSGVTASPAAVFPVSRLAWSFRPISRAVPDTGVARR
jgi:hypothetical protein